jgi:cytoskeletal protein RodZ
VNAPGTIERTVEAPDTPQSTLTNDPIRPITRTTRVSSLRTAGLSAVPSLKSMRSTAVTNLHAEGVALEVIANVTGHVDETVTREHYLAVTAENTRRGFETLAERLRP